MALHAYRTFYEDAPEAMSDPGQKSPEPGPTQGEILTLGGALGAGWGASKIIQAGAIAVNGGAIAVGAAAATGLFAAGIAGWSLGKLIGETEVVKDGLNQLIDWALEDPNKGSEHLRAPAIDKEAPDQSWLFENSEGQTREVWFYVSGDDSREGFAADLADGGIDLYSDPFYAMEMAQEIGIIGQGNDMSGLYMLYLDFVAGTA